MRVSSPIRRGCCFRRGRRSSLSISAWRQRRRGPRSAHCNDPLDDRSARDRNFAFFKRGDGQRACERREEFPPIKQKIRTTGASELFVPCGECFIQQHTVGGDAVDQAWEQRTVKIVCHHHAAECLTDQWPGGSILQVGFDPVHPWLSGQIRNTAPIAINKRNRMPPAGEVPTVPSAPAGQVQNGRARRRQWGKPHHPRGWRSGQAW